MHWLSSVRLPATTGLWRIGVDQEQRIAAIEPLSGGSAAAGACWSGDWLSPMGLDLQINGGLGLAFPELGPGDLPRLLELLELLWRDGVEAIAPTLVTCGIAELRQALGVLREARALHQPGRCQLLGAHLEGPFLAEARRGAHPRQHLAAPSLEALNARIAGFEQEIALVTLAPELSGAGEVIEALRELGILVSLGHSEASEHQAAEAFGQGVGMITHAFNAMPGLHHRAPGPIAAAALRGDVALGLIADGVHVAPSMAVLLQRLMPEQTLLVSDALAPYGLADGVHRWDERALIVEQGSCRLEDGTLAGVTLPLLEAVRRLAGWSGEAGQAIAAATVLPRRLLGAPSSAAEQLHGRPLAQCLRWSGAASDLRWQWAA
ncbi:MAG: N-acetylglucosamine-6-phosphate deacetylase [Vulcanococcus sp.]|jgi:N-acetylglucosamine-6-phosphate deacetylase|uniref:N-acetylglucosamine-6-phosphate deacetylase n=1 Tax=Vulcanococcus sp. TaxID=2856995 RepID=UPI0025D0A9B8|nr:N-acetylglucosamine-6-phosphate deacetylase [Vulcanococcus sp.]MBW0173135.1 N-acetylglucosamine-6-phosphate deacetylase [Vulcanococcus sp.]MBW0181881.1 N-acetylglucosamine-6-phosphate deacetylase [Vulcanococcus sp.]